MSLASHLVFTLSRFVNTWTDWGASAAIGFVFRARLPGMKAVALKEPRVPFSFRGVADKNVLNILSMDFGYIETTGKKPIKTIVDAGANIGVFSVLASRLYPGARIVALEAEEENFKVLAQNLREIPTANAVHAALWRDSNGVDLLVSDYAQSHSVAAPTEEIRSTVASFGVADLMEKFDLPGIDLLKMDIEGAEGAVMDGLSMDVLRKINVIMFECNDTDVPGTAMRVIRPLLGEDFDAFAWGEHLFLCRRRTGWKFRRRYAGVGGIWSQQRLEYPVR